MGTERIELYDGARECRPLGFEEARSQLETAGGTVWLHIVGGEHEARREMFESLGFFELQIEDALSDEERPSLVEEEGGIFLVLPLLKEPSEEIAIWMRPGGIVTYVAAEVPLVTRSYERWRAHPAHLGDTPPALLHEVVDAVTDSYLPVIDALEDEADALTERVIEGEPKANGEVLRLKREFMAVRRKIVPARDVISGLLRRDATLIPPDLRPYFQDVYDHVNRDVELIELNRDTLASTLDVHLGMQSQRLNEVMKTMTVYSLMLMAPALIAGIYGMNFELMPELKWRFGYPFALLLMGIASGAIWIAFRRRGWV